MGSGLAGGGVVGVTIWGDVQAANKPIAPSNPKKRILKIQIIISMIAVDYPAKMDGGL